MAYRVSCYTHSPHLNIPRSFEIVIYLILEHINQDIWMCLACIYCAQTGVKCPHCPPVVQLVPPYAGVHVQLYPVPEGVHVPPFSQGSGKHGKSAM